MKPSNIDTEVVEVFGKEWPNFNQSELSEKEQLEIFNLYFDSFPWYKLSQSSVGMENAGLENITFSNHSPCWCATRI
ncbi:MAG: hypothetical protein RH949_19235 [Coleofasciculus sp. A1-SPW-01]|uniref:hypothetical protein n=1 Tax=Coleofasciculus sp. A1-SPW-01 TaxID=3070819 RepID=UPI0033044C17